MNTPKPSIRRKPLRSLTAAKVREKEFVMLPVEPGFWGELLGTPPMYFTALVYGPPKQGKSWLITQWANKLTRHYKVHYISAEEGFNYSLKRRLDELKIDNPNLLFYNYTDEDSVLRIIQNRLNKCIIVDSPDHVGMSLDKMVELVNKYKGRKTIILLKQVDGKGLPKGGHDWPHLVDIILRMDGKYVHQQGRFGGAPKLPAPWQPTAETPKTTTPDLFNSPQ